MTRSGGKTEPGKYRWVKLVTGMNYPKATTEDECQARSTSQECPAGNRGSDHQAQVELEEKITEELIDELAKASNVKKPDLPEQARKRYLNLAKNKKPGKRF